MVRCFIALEPDDAALGELHHLAAKLDPTGWRMTPASKYHVTLKFLGDVAEDEIPRICDMIRQATNGIRPLLLRGTHISAIPNDRRPRVLAASFEPDAGTLELVERMEILLTDAGFAIEQRAYHPHVTLARKIRSSKGRLHRISPQTTPHQVQFAADEVVLMQSILSHDGAIYDAIQRFPLK